MDYLRRSAVPYLVALVAAVMVGAYGNYLAPLAVEGGIAIKGQSLGIVIPILIFPIALALWLIYKGRASRSIWLQLFLAGLTISWLVHFAITRYHGDMFIHTVWLFIPVVLMVMLKSPDSQEAWQTLVTLAWIAASIMVLTRALEMLGAIPQWFYPTPDQAQWEIDHYWLPFAGYFDVASRWPGPFGFNSKTGFVSVLLVVIALARWRRISSPVFLTVGILGMLLTGGRGVYLSALAGILVLVLFTQVGVLKRVPSWARLAVIVLGVAVVAYYFAFGSATATTGRIGSGGIWDAFLVLWQSNPIFGVGQTGIWNAPNRAREIMDAHSIFIQELAQFGLVGFLFTYATLAIGLAATIIAAMRNWAGPLAIMAIYFTAGVTDLLHTGWLSHSMHTIMIILVVASASAWLQERKTTSEPGRAGESVHTPTG